MSKLVSGRVKRTPQTGITSDRYQFLGLDQAEPDLGDPLVGPSSISANPAPPGTQFILVNIGGQTGKRYWVPSNQAIVGALAPGSFTVFNNNVQVGLANSFNVFNFVGTGVTVDFVGNNISDQTGIATVRITVTDLIAPGNPYEIPYKNPSTGFLSGATGVVFRNNNIGIGSTIPTQKLDVIGNINATGQVGANTASVGFITGNSSYFSISTSVNSFIANNLNVGTSSTVIKTLNSNVGIGSTIPKYKLDIFGSSRFYGAIYDYLGSSGNPGESLISNGASPPTWGIVGADSAVGLAVSVSTKEATNNQLYYIGFSSTTNNFSSLYVDSNGLYYNPSSVRLGIGTQPEYSLDVNGTIRAGQIIAQSFAESPGVTTTTSINTSIIDTFNTASYRSARYNIQVTANNQLRLGSASVSGINSGLNYSSGTYNDIVLISSGVGTGAKASITVTAPAYPITVSLAGSFTTSNSITGIPTGFSVSFGSSVAPSPLEQSKLTSIQVVNSGAGYTTVPTITLSSPVIIGNPVDGVGVGSTAIVTRTSMTVTNVILNSSGIVTNTVPTMTFNTPIGIGETATGYIGFGISTFNVTGPGTGYTSSPTVTYNPPPTIPIRTASGIVSSTSLSTISGINTSSLVIGDYIAGTFILSNTRITGIGTSSLTIVPNHTNSSGIATTTFAFLRYPTTRVGLGISDLNVQITGGIGYNTGITTFIVTAVGGIGTGGSIILGATDGSGRITDIDIANVGSGYTVPPTVTILNNGSGIGAAVTITTMVVTNINVDNPSSGFGTEKPAIGFTGGGGSGAAATVANVLITSLEVKNSGYGYTTSDMPVTATISAAGVGNTVGLGIYSVTATTGLGYTRNPSFTISSPTISPLVGASLTSAIGYGSTYNLLAGPGYGGTTVYYIRPINSNSFRLTKDFAGTDAIFLGYSTSPTPVAYIGGNVSSISITNSGSGYQVGETLTVNNSSLKDQYTETVGTGFSFSIAGPLIQNFQVSDVMLLHSVGSASTDVNIVEYAGIANLENLGEYSADISGSNVRLKITPTYAHNTIKITRKGTDL